MSSSSQLPPLQAAVSFDLRTEMVDCAELGGAVQVRGLMASESFALDYRRSQALRSVREARREHDERMASWPDGKPQPPFEPPGLSFDEAKAFGLYVNELLAQTVRLATNGLQLYSAAEWDVVGQHHPGLLSRLRDVAERLSGMNAEDVEKNSTSSPS